MGLGGSVRTFEKLSEAEIEGLKRRLSERPKPLAEPTIFLMPASLYSGRTLNLDAKSPPENLNIFISGDVSGYNFGALYLLGSSTKPVR